jgi:hypothetical protein
MQFYAPLGHTYFPALGCMGNAPKDLQINPARYLDPLAMSVWPKIQQAPHGTRVFNKIDQQYPVPYLIVTATILSAVFCKPCPKSNTINIVTPH